jgi:hypothetical protein
MNTQERFLPESGVIIYDDDFDVETLTADDAKACLKLATAELQKLDPDWQDWYHEDPAEWGEEYHEDAFDALSGALAWLSEFYPAKTEQEILNLITGVDRFI